jgi:excisionase family DNA binding protein
MEADNPTLALTVEEAAREARISARHLHRLIANREGPPVARLGSRNVIRREALDAWLRSREEPAAS